MSGKIIVKNSFKSMSEDVVFPGVVWIKKVERIHFNAANVSVVNERQASFKKCVVFSSPMTVKRMCNEVAVIQFTEDKTID